jgi:hypothetical protein
MPGYSRPMTNGERFSAGAAQKFADKYGAATSEKQLAQSFWRDFFGDVVGIADLMAAGIEFEFPVRSSSTGNLGFIDVLWPQVALIEHKSAGQNLDKAEAQARDYLISLEPAARPPVIVLSDFKSMRIIEVLAGTSVEFSLADLPDHLDRFEAIIGARGSGAARIEETADAKAAELMSALFVSFEKAGYEGHEVSVFLVRVLFLLFGDDTRLWKRHSDEGLFEYLVSSSSEDGTGLGGTIQELFQVLNTPRDQRRGSLSSVLVDFPYANGGLFSESLEVFSFTKEMRSALLEACRYNWSGISPAIFGAMFQNIKSKEARRELGEHYTSEANILKVIGPLFLNDFNDRLHKEWDRPAGLKQFQKELGTYTWLDPACGCGNFLLVTYKRMRDIDLRIAARLQELEGKNTAALDGTWLLNIHLSQFYGIEYEEWSSQIANVAMFLAEHQANTAMEKLLGSAPDLLPLTDHANIVHGNALRIEWSDVVPINQKTFIMGNPPFYGARWQTKDQKEDTKLTWRGSRGCGDLDYVTNWFYKAAEACSQLDCSAAFVATSSISQGEQPPLIWTELTRMGIGIDFAHRTFRWTNQSKGQASVHTVVIGFSSRIKPGKRFLWLYKTPDSLPQLKLATNINAYLIDSPNVLIFSRKTPLAPDVPVMKFGSMPNDGGFLSSIDGAEAKRILESDPIAGRFLRRLIGGQELIHDEERYCLWLADAAPADIRDSTEISSRVEDVRRIRSSSKRAATRALADRPTEFGENRHPKHEYLAIPLITGHTRAYLPVALLGPNIVANNKVGIISDKPYLALSLLSSRVFTIWNKAVSGRLKSDLNLSIGTTWNCFPVPTISPSLNAGLIASAQGVLEARVESPSTSLADLYDRNSMPSDLRHAHASNDKTVLKVFGLKPAATDEEILKRLFELYAEYTSDLRT